jgi:hypothetical protein
MKNLLLVLALVFSATLGYTQRLDTIFNGCLERVTQTAILGSNQYEIKGNFYNWSGTFDGTEIPIGTPSNYYILVESSGFAFEMPIVNVIGSGSVMILEVEDIGGLLGGVPGAQAGIYRRMPNCNYIPDIQCLNNTTRAHAMVHNFIKLDSACTNAGIPQVLTVTDNTTYANIAISDTTSSFNLYEGSNITLDISGNDITINAAAEGSSDGVVTPTGSGYTSETLTLARTQGLPAITIGIPQVGVKTQGTLVDSDPVAIDFGPNFTVTQALADVTVTVDFPDDSNTNEIQTLSWDAGTAGNDEITLSDGGGTITITDDVNDADASATNELQIITRTAGTNGNDVLTLSVNSSNDAIVDNVVNSASFATNSGVLTLGTVETPDITVNLDGRYITADTDDQNLGLSGTTNPTVTITDGTGLTVSGINGIAVTNATGTLQIDGSGITGSTDYINSVSMTDADADDIWDISLTGIGNAGASTTVNLSQYLDNTDAQDLSLSGNILSVTNDPTADVDLSQYLDNTDTQNLGLSGVDQSTNPQITITDGTSLSTAGINGIVVRNNGGTLEIDGSAVSGTFNSFDITDGVTTETVEDSDVVTFGVLANATNTLAVDVSPTDAVDIGFNTSGASNGQVLKFNGTSVEWAADNSAASGMGSFLYTDGTSTVTITDGQSIGVTAGTLIDATLSGNNIVVGLDNTVGANDQVITKVGGTWVAADLPADDAGTDDQNLVFDVTTDPAVPTLEIETGGGDLEFLANNLLTVSGQNTPNQLTYGIDPTGATNGQVITYQTVGGVQWADASSGADGYLQGVTPSIPSTDVVELDFDLNGATDVNDIQFSIADSDANPSNEIQDLTWSAGSNGNDEITLTNGGSTVTITDDTGTDDQSISIADGNNPLLTLESGGTLRLTGGGATTISAVNSTGVITISSTDDSGTDDQTISVADAVSNPTIALESGGTIDLAGGGATSVSASGGVITITSTDNNTQLSQEQVQDFIGPLVANNTETLISVEYNDTGNELNFVVEDDLSNYDNSVTQFISDVTIDVTDGTNVTGISNGDAITFTEDNVVSVVENAGEITIGLDNNQGSDGQIIKKIAGVWSIGADNVSGGGDADGVVDGMSLGGAPNYTLTLSRTEGLDPLTQNLSALSDAWTIRADDDNTEVISSSTVDFTGLTGISTAWDAVNNELEITNTAPESTSIDDTPTLDLTLNAGQITGAVEISGTSGNRITAEADGLYVPAEVDGSTTNEIQNLFQSITDGTTSAIADGSTDEFKLRSANSLLTIVTANDDVTHGDNALFSIDDDLANYDNSVTQFLQSETQNLFETITVGGQSVTADNTTDDVEFIADGDITITPNTTNDKITFSVTNTVDTDTRVNLANDANSITNATLLTFNSSDFNSSVNGSEMTIQLADGTDNNNYVTGLVMTDDDNDDEWEITVSRLGLAAIEEVVDLNKYLDDTDTRTTITDGTTSLSNAENLVFDPLDFNVSANATDFSVGINFPVDQNDNNYITGFTMLDGDANDVWDITITRDGLGNITEAVNLSKYLDDTDTRVNITGDGTTIINDATDLVFNSTHFNVSANSGEMTVSLADAVDNNNYATGITMTDANNDDVWDITVARNGLADLTETVNLGEYVNTDNQSMSVNNVNNPTLTLTDEGSGSTVQFTGGDNITTTGSGADNVIIDWAANLPELSDVPAYPTATTVNYVLLHDDNTGTNSWTDVSGWDQNAGDDFDGLFTSLNFTGTTGFSDNIDNDNQSFTFSTPVVGTERVTITGSNDYFDITGAGNATVSRTSDEITITATDSPLAANSSSANDFDLTNTTGTVNISWNNAALVFGVEVVDANNVRLNADNPGGDRVVFWDASDTRMEYGIIGSGLTFNANTLELDANLPDLNDVPVYPTGGTDTYALIHDDNVGTNSWVATTNWDTDVNDDFSGLFTDLDFTGTTGFDDNVDNVGPTYDSGHGIEVDNTADEINLGFTSKNTAAANHLTSEVSGTETYIGIDDATNGDALVILDGTQSAGTGNAYPFRIASHTFNYGNILNNIHTGIRFEQWADRAFSPTSDYADDELDWEAGIQLKSQYGSGGFIAPNSQLKIRSDYDIALEPASGQQLYFYNLEDDAGDNNTIVLTMAGDAVQKTDLSALDAGSLVASSGNTNSFALTHNGNTEIDFNFDATTSSILSVTGVTATNVDIRADDPGTEDRIVFWDDSDNTTGALDYLIIGTGLEITNNTLNNTVPDVTVTFDDSDPGITISGTYPNFTVTNDLPEATTITDGNTINFTLTGTDITGEVLLSQDGGNILELGTDNRLYAAADGFEANTDETVKVSSNETSAGYLEDQVATSNVTGTALQVATTGEGANEQVVFTLTPANLELDLSLTGDILELTHDATTVDLSAYDNDGTIQFNTSDGNDTRATISHNSGAESIWFSSASSLSDVLYIDESSSTQALLYGNDAGAADAIVFWDNDGGTTGKLTYLTVGSGLTLTGTTLTADGDGFQANTDNQTLTVNSIASNPTVTLSRDDTPSQIQFIGTGNTTVSANGTNITINSTGDGIGSFEFDTGDLDNEAITMTHNSSDYVLQVDVNAASVFYMDENSASEAELYAKDYGAEDAIVGWDNNPGRLGYFTLGDGLATDGTELYCTITDTSIPDDQTLTVNPTGANPSIVLSEAAGGFGTINFSGDQGVTITGSTGAIDIDVKHDNLSDFVANEHINHANVVLTAGNGLSGGGNITTSRTFTVNTANSVTIANDNVQLLNDAASPGNEYYYGTNGSGVKGWYALSSEVDAENGLTKTGSTIRLGGVLMQDTEIELYNSTDVTGYPFVLNYDDGTNADSLFYTNTGEFWIKANDKATDQRSYFTMGEDGANINMYRGPDNTYGNELYFNLQGRTIGLNNVNGDTTSRILLESELGAMTEVSILGVGNVGVGSKVITDGNPEVIIRTRDVNDNTAEEGALLQLQNTVGAANGASEFTPYTFPTTSTNGGKMLVTDASGDLNFVDTTGLFGGGGSSAPLIPSIGSYALIDSAGVDIDDVIDVSADITSYDYAMMPRIMAGLNGALYQFFRVGNQHTVSDNDPGVLIGRKSIDGGNTWTGTDGTGNYTTIIDDDYYGAGTGVVNIGCGLTPTGRIIVHFAVSDNTGGSPSMVGMGTCYSDDFGDTWNIQPMSSVDYDDPTPSQYHGSPLSTQYGIKPDGTLCTPFTWKDGSGTRNIRMLESSDNGLTWVATDTIFNHASSGTTYTNTSDGLVEPAMADLGNGVWAIVARMRGATISPITGDNYPVILFSFDYGETWSDDGNSVTWEDVYAGNHGAGFLQMEGSGVSLGLPANYEDAQPHIELLMYEGRRYLAVLYYIRDNNVDRGDVKFGSNPC